MLWQCDRFVSVLEGVRKRKGNLTNSEDHKSTKKEVTFEVTLSTNFRTDFHKDGGFQKAVQITKDLSVMVTGGADGKLRLWKVKIFKMKLLEIIVNLHKDKTEKFKIDLYFSKIKCYRDLGANWKKQLSRYSLNMIWLQYNKVILVLIYSCVW